MAQASDDARLQVDEMGFPLYFQKYKKERCMDAYGRIKCWILWNEDNEEPEHPPGFLYSSWELKQRIRVILKSFMDFNASKYPISLLIQFWEPVLIEGRTLLTTRHQPFAINSIHEGLCRYRVKSESYKFYVNERQIKDELGLPGRVFIHKLPEFSPNIEYYTIKEYPQRRDASRCQITCVNAYPVLDPSWQSCIGVLEIAMSTQREPCGYKHPRYYLSFLEKEDLVIPILLDHSYRQIGDGDEAFEAASKEMREALKKVCEAHNLDLAQTWAVCSLCMSNASYTGQVISTLGSLFYAKDGKGGNGYGPGDFLVICDSFHLREGQGVAGQALSSDGLIFCFDITQFSVVEYPIAHFAKLHGLRSSFAICLRSSRTGSHLYILEFFLPSSLKINGSIINLLHNILGTMKLHFQTFKLASGKDLGEKLPIQVVDHDNKGEKYNCNTLEVESQIATSPQGPPGTLQDEGEIMQQDPSSQQSIDKAANAEQSNINCTSSRGSNVNQPTLKRICREHNINRWPPRNIKENCSLPQGDDDGQQILRLSHGMSSSSNQVLPTIAHTNSHDTMMPDVNFVNVKAMHTDHIIKFKLLLSSGLAELQHEIAKRLKLTGGTYDIKYKDEENELILITCDEDVQYWIRTCGSQGSNSLKVFLMAK